jgi:hypothetical protein
MAPAYAAPVAACLLLAEVIDTAMNVWRSACQARTARACHTAVIAFFNCRPLLRSQLLGLIMMDARTPFSETAVSPHWRPEGCDRVALVLQGGGALGAYQAGVYQALHEAGMEPDWVCGVSIGAINSAIIAGNPPERRLERLHIFWTASPRGKSGTIRRMATSTARPGI